MIPDLYILELHVGGELTFVTSVSDFHDIPKVIRQHVYTKCVVSHWQRPEPRFADRPQWKLKSKANWHG